MSEETIRLFKKWMWGEEETVKEFSREEVEKTVNAIDCVLGYDFEDAPVVARYALYLVKRAREEDKVEKVVESWEIIAYRYEALLTQERQKVAKLRAGLKWCADRGIGEKARQVLEETK